jgi:hypothetical protein
VLIGDPDLQANCRLLRVSLPYLWRAS